MKALTILAVLMLCAGCVLAVVAITVPVWMPPLYWQLYPLTTPVPGEGPIGLLVMAI